MNYYIIIVLTAFTLVVETHRSGNSSRLRESLDFLFPDELTAIGRKCKSYSNWFCLSGYRTNQRLGRESQTSDREEFKQMIALAFDEINWFSFKPEDTLNGGCCSYQVNSYIENGQRNGLTPSDFMDKIFQLNSGRVMNLVYIQARWNPHLRTNIVAQVGFGKGILKLSRGRGNAFPFVIPPLGSSNEDEVYMFNGRTVRDNLTFRWFISNVLCEEKPWLCESPRDDVENYRHR
ncbi:uncharacterized protein LOC142349556 [Convolutriloba macropyga]|uniref:uncharacterized protein LOC142349556 n=1 Tax=Convolutriloba macropyga TaxID=536237 RepID=UPI003F51BA4B